MRSNSGPQDEGGSKQWHTASTFILRPIPAAIFGVLCTASVIIDRAMNPGSLDAIVALTILWSWLLLERAIILILERL